MKKNSISVRSNRIVGEGFIWQRLDGGSAGKESACNEGDLG